MLSNEAKYVLKYVSDTVIARCGIEELQQDGPKFYIQNTIDTARMAKSDMVRRIGVNLTENREEAERFLAGMWGMM